MIVLFLGWFASAKHGRPVPPARFIIGTSVAFLILEILADVDPPLASALAVAIGTTATFHYGSVLRSVADAGGIPSAKPAHHVTQSVTPVHVTSEGDNHA
jgi:hypothetical protein